MSKTGKTIVTVIIIIVVIGVIWWLVAKPSNGTAPASMNDQSQNPAASETTEAGTNPAPSAPAAAVTASTSIDSDLNSIDSQMNGLNQDNANVGESVTPSSNQ